MPDPLPPRTVDRLASWLRATPAELVGLALLLLGSLAATALLWWGAVQRPSTLPSRDLADGALAGPELAGSGVPGRQQHGHGGAGAEPDPWEAEPDGSEDAGQVVVHVAGAVADPGVVTLRAGARVGEAIEAAGGLLEGADASWINLARQLQDGEHVYLPREGEELPAGWDPGAAATGGPGTASGSGAIGSDGRLDLNRATAAELESLPGIGPARAQAIVRHRQEHGPFRQPGDLRAVSGIGERTFQQLAELIAVR